MPQIEVIRPLRLNPTGGTELVAGNRGSNNVFYGLTSLVSAENKIGTLLPGEALYLTKGFVWVIGEKVAGAKLQQPAIMDLAWITPGTEFVIPPTESEKEREEREHKEEEERHQKEKEQKEKEEEEAAVPYPALNLYPAIDLYPNV